MPKRERPPGAPIIMNEAADVLGVSRRWLQAFLQTIPPCHLAAGHKKLFDEQALRILRRRIDAAKFAPRVSTADANRAALEDTQAEARQNAIFDDPNRARKFVGGPHSPVVYFIRSGQYVKIGTTKALDRRLATLEAHGPTKLRVCLLLDGGKKLEAELHAQFARQRHRGEWFRLSDAVRGFIGRHGGTFA